MHPASRSCFSLGGRIWDVSGLVDFDLSINKLYSQREHSHSKSGVDTKLVETIITLESGATIQRTLAELERGADRKLMMSNKNKCRTLPLGDIGHSVWFNSSQ